MYTVLTAQQSNTSGSEHLVLSYSDAAVREACLTMDAAHHMGTTQLM
jgi:hypothetical protein